MRSGHDGAPDRPQHVKLVKGRWYWDPPDRLRKSHGLKTQPLGAEQSAAWALARILNRDHLQLGPGTPVIGSVSWLFEAFLLSDRFGGLRPNTQRDYRWLTQRVLGPLQLGRRALGEYPALAIKPKHADAIYSLIENDRGHAAAHYACRVVRRIWHWGARREMVEANPWTGMELRSVPQRRQRWSQAQIEAVQQKARELGRSSISLAVSLAHREGDVLALTWTALDNGELETSKTRAVVPIDIAAYPTLAGEISAERARQRLSGVASTHVVVCESTRRPWQQHSFVHEFRRIAQAAGIPDDLQFRDLRATALTELNDAGVDVLPMSTHSGHQTVQMARRYARPTQQQFSRAASQRLEHLAHKQGNRQGNRETEGC